MEHPLAGVMEKLRRANTHLMTAHDEVAAYLDSTPYRLSAHLDTGDGKPGYTFHITAQPPLRLSCIIGDILHNMRSALDYIAYALVIRNGFTPTWQTQFPLCSTERDFLNESFHRNRLAGISRRSLKMIDACQPYRFGPDKYAIHPLWHLHKLSNLDKHKTLALGALGVNCTVDFTHPDGRTLHCELSQRLVHDSAVVATMPADFFDPKIKTHLKITCQVSFCDAPVIDLEVINVLHNLLKFIGEFVIPLIDPLFDEMPDSIRLSRHGLPPEVFEARGKPPDNPLPSVMAKLRRGLQ